MVHPQRSDSGYRLYSDRDIAIIRWLKSQVDAGMSISQAVVWLDKLSAETEDGQVTLPFVTESSTSPIHANPARSKSRDLPTLQGELIDALVGYDESAAEQTLAEAFALYPIEQVGEELIVPVLVNIGELWHNGDISITTEHYATNYLMQRLMTLLRVGVSHTSGPAIWVGCAPSELHEIGALMLTVFLRRAGFNVQYLGRNLPVDDLVREAKRQQPAMVIFSANSLEAAQGLSHMTVSLIDLDPPRPMIGYGGRIFNEQPDLRNSIVGIYLGETAQDAVGKIDEMMRSTVTHNSF